MSTNKILVVDDIATNRTVLRQMLSRITGYTVIEAVDGKESISVFKEENPDLILMDINMPEMDGLQATKLIKQSAGDDYIPIIFVTALTEESSLSNALASGGDDYVSKPFDAEVLKSKIHAHLRIRDLNKQLQANNVELSNVNQQLIREHDLIEHFFKSALEQSYLDERFVNYHMSSMSTFNGDIFFAQRSPQGGLYIVMGDFTGHGLTAAMGTIPVAMIFFKMVIKGMAISDIARELNHQLHKLLPTSMFFAATLVELNAQGNILTAWKGGMPESYWLNENNDLKGAIQSQHMPLGILDDGDFDDKTEIFSVEQNDKFYFYSDGVTEAINPDGEMFGSERLCDALVSTSSNRIEKVLNDISEFKSSSVQNDDITLVELSCHEAPELEPVVECIADNRFSIPWNMSLSLSTSDMRDKDPVEELSETLGSLPVLQRHKGILAALLSEIYFNALDYSILELDTVEKNNEEQFIEYYKLRDERLNKLVDASITFDLSYEPVNQQLLIKIQDSGKGYQGHSSISSDDELHGRGLEIISSLCENVQFSDEGRLLSLIYRL